MKEATKHQIMAIQSKVIIEYLLGRTVYGYSDEDMDKIQMMFNITNNNDIYYGIKKGNADGGAHQTPSGD